MPESHALKRASPLSCRAALLITDNFLIQPFVNHNFPGGFYINSGPIITANWKADSSQRWTVPLGGGIARSSTWASCR
jgi:hypothetical protein